MICCHNTSPSVRRIRRTPSQLRPSKTDSYTTWHAATTPVPYYIAYNAQLANYTLYNRFLHNMIRCHNTSLSLRSVRSTPSQLRPSKTDSYTTWYAATTPVPHYIAYNAHLANYTLYNRFLHNMIRCHNTSLSMRSVRSTPSQLRPSKTGSYTIWYAATTRPSLHSIQRTPSKLNPLQQIPTQHDMLPQHQSLTT